MSETKKTPSFVDPSADVILTSSDGVDFPVMRGIMCMASPVFRDMFSLPQGMTTSTKIHVDGATEDLPRVDVSENSHVLDGFLCIVYPVDPPKIKSDSEEEFEKAKQLLITAVKYDAKRAISYIFQTLFESIKASSGTRMALRLYALASRHSLKDHIQQAALLCLRGDIIEACEGARIPEFESTNANSLLCLFKFQRAASEEVLKVIKEHWEDDSLAEDSEFGPGYYIRCNECGEISIDEQKDTDNYYYHNARRPAGRARWWRTWLASVESAVKKAPLCDPFSISLLDPLTKIAANCTGDFPRCRDFELAVFVEDRDEILERIRVVVEKLGMDLTLI